MTYPSKPSSAPAIPFNSVGKSKNLNDIISAIGIEKLLALKTDGTYDDNFSIGDNALNSLVNEINIRVGSTIKEYDSTGANLLRTLTLGSATNLVQGFRYLDDPIKISNNATNPTTEIDVSAGIMTFDDGTGQVRLSTSLTKSTANDFANNGLLPNGAVLQTDTIYYVFAIYSSASNLVSFYADTSKTSPTLPTSPNVYDKKQYRGAFYIDGNGNIKQGLYVFCKDFYEFEYLDPILDVSQGVSTTASLFPLSCPINSKVDINAYFIEPFSVAGVYISNPNITDVLPSTSTSPLFTLYSADGGGAADTSGKVSIYTNNLSQVRVRADRNIQNFKIATLGWKENL